MIRSLHDARALIATIATAITFSTIVAGCSGGGSSLAPTTTPSNAPSKSASISFTMHWTSASKPAPASRHRNYVPSTAQSVTVSVDGGQAQYLNNPATTLVIAAPPGVDNFAFATYDEQNGQGNELSAATVTQTVLAGSGNFVSATLNALVASIGVSLGNPALPAGAAATTPVNVTALDADGNVIVGPGQYDTPIHLSVNDPTKSGTLSLSSNLVQSPSLPSNVTLSYNGGTLASGLPGDASATVVATASGLLPASVAFTPTPTIYPITLSYPSGANASSNFSSIVAGPDGNMWALDEYNNSIDKITLSGNVTTYPLPSGLNVFSDDQRIISASDGNLWFTAGSSSTTGCIGTISTSGSFNTFSTVNNVPTALTDGKNGFIYYIDGKAIGAENLSRPQDVTSETSLPDYVNALTAGSDRNLYMAGSSGEILRLPVTNLSATASTYRSPSTTLNGIYNILLGPDGNVWFDDGPDSNIQMLDQTTFSVAQSYQLIPAGGNPNQIAIGKDAAFWIANGTEYGVAAGISRITTSGGQSFIPDGLLGSNVIGAAPDGSLWFNDTFALYKLVY